MPDALPSPWAIGSTCSTHALASVQMTNPEISQQNIFVSPYICVFLSSNMSSPYTSTTVFPPGLQNIDAEKMDVDLGLCHLK